MSNVANVVRLRCLWQSFGPTSIQHCFIPRNWRNRCKTNDLSDFLNGTWPQPFLPILTPCGRQCRVISSYFRFQLCAMKMTFLPNKSFTNKTKTKKPFCAFRIVHWLISRRPSLHFHCLNGSPMVFVGRAGGYCYSFIINVEILMYMLFCTAQFPHVGAMSQMGLMEWNGTRTGRMAHSVRAEVRLKFL